ncbi:glycosyltransferase [Modestobacter sp. VKM Ac-2978]|uniref:glycosyltransferase n=1 Tax=Modestobacter sp. VKM Ac-2978 TaxID=3004132 RepID=UPI0022AA41AF|nr:glycosyltransferase [Modestobacter sp. VKM Ac-2978]MCZ2846577.1 glycosyltransferase [Modestobacter sp. VKM Ac-2978]
MVELNPRNLNTIVLLLTRRVLKRRTTVWGHVWPRSGKDSATARLRLLLCQIADGALLYTDREAGELRSALPNVKTYVAHNSLYPRWRMGASETAPEPERFVWIGRLSADKNPLLAINAFGHYRANGHAAAKLVVFGSGNQEGALREQVGRLKLDDHVDFRGWVNDPVVLQSEFQRAVACISSGYVGLNVTQALGFGCPVIWPFGVNHAPEFVLLNERNSVSFAAGDHESLSGAMSQIASMEVDRHEIAKVVADTYSTEKMAEGLLACLIN